MGIISEWTPSSEKVQVLNEDGEVVNEELMPDLSDDTLVQMYREMKLLREFDEKCVNLQRSNRMGTYPPLSGQEASQIGSVFALEDRDWVVPSYREQGVQRNKGMDLSTIMAYWMGSEMGAKIEKDVNVFTMCVPIATHIPHASGMAWSSKLKDEDKVFACYFGDGATSEGDFHEGMNFAGVFNVPAVFFCNNNQYAISVPRERQTASQTIAQKARAYGFEGIQVDGMDVLATYKVTQEAVRKARGESNHDMRPTMIEAIQYRYGAHTTADDPGKYRDEEEVEEWKQKDPIDRLEVFLKNTNRLNDSEVETMEDEIQEEISDAVDTAEELSSKDKPEDMFEYVFEDETPHLRDQRDKHYGDTNE